MDDSNLQLDNVQIFQFKKADLPLATSMVLEAEPVYLSAGPHVLKIEREASNSLGPKDFSLDYFTFSLAPNLRVPENLAGSPESGHVDGKGSQARFSSQITGIGVDQRGQVYLADAGNGCIRKITPEGEVITLAGSGTAGYVDGPGWQAQFTNLDSWHCLAVDGDGQCFVLDRDTIHSVYRIRSISTNGIVSTLASLPWNPDQGVGMYSSRERYINLLQQPSGQLIYNKRTSGFRSQRDEIWEWSIAKTNSPSHPLLTGAELIYSLNSGAYEGPRLIDLAAGSGTNIYATWYTSSMASYTRHAVSLLGYAMSTNFLDQSLLSPGFGAIAAGPSNSLFYVEGNSRIIQMIHRESHLIFQSSAILTNPIASAADGTLYASISHQVVRLTDQANSILQVWVAGGGAFQTEAALNSPLPTNTIAHLTALPAPGWHFLEWRGTTPSSNASVEVTLRDHQVLNPVFGAPVSAQAQHGSFLREPDLDYYPYASPVKLTAQPEAGYKFLMWEDGNTNLVRSLIVTNPLSVTAEFELLQRWTLKGEVAGGVGGTVEMFPPSAFYEGSEIVTLIAHPAPGYHFDKWQDENRENPRPILMTSNTVMVAVFSPGDPTAPFITRAPQNLSTNVGAPVRFTVEAEGGSPLKYQWQHNGTNITAANGPVLNLPPLTSSDGGSYTVLVSNSKGQASATALLQVLDTPEWRFISSSIRNTMPGDFRSFVIYARCKTGKRFYWQTSYDLVHWTNTWRQPSTATDLVDGAGFEVQQGKSGQFFRILEVP